MIGNYKTAHPLSFFIEIRTKNVFFLLGLITERLYLIQRRSNMAVKLTRNEHDYCHGNI